MLDGDMAWGWESMLEGEEHFGIYSATLSERGHWASSKSFVLR